MSHNVLSYLNTKISRSYLMKSAINWTQIKYSLENKEWIGLGKRLLELVRKPSLQNEADLLDVYENCVQPIEYDIEPFTLVEIMDAVLRFVNIKKHPLTMCIRLSPVVADDEEAKHYLEVLKGQLFLFKYTNLTQAEIIVRDLMPIFDDINRPMTRVHPHFFMFAARYYEAVKDAKEHLRCLLEFVRCVDNFPHDLLPLLAIEIAITALLVPDRFEYREILNLTIMDSLKHTYDEWIIELLLAFTDGDISGFEQLRRRWMRIPKLFKNKKKLRRKLSVLAFASKCLSARNGRPFYVEFAEIAMETGIQLSSVPEFMQRAMDYKLFTGIIQKDRENIFVENYDPINVDRFLIPANATQREDLELKETFEEFETC